MIKYRPQKSTLEESLNRAREFDTLDEMYDYIVSEWSEQSELFSKEDLCVSDSSEKDSRTDWRETRYVCLKRMGNQVYTTPQCIGMCSIE